MTGDRHTTGGIVLRPMTTADLELVRKWLLEPHVARWWNDPVDEQYAEFERTLAGGEPTELRILTLHGSAIGLVQWYRWSDYPQAADYGARDGDVGIDYLIGEPHLIDRGLGTAMIHAVVRALSAETPGASVLVGVDAQNAASRRVLEKNGFVLVDERDIASEAEPLTALYRLEPGAVG